MICIRMGNANLVQGASIGNEVRRQEVANSFFYRHDERATANRLGGSESEDKLAEDRFGNDRPLSYQPQFPKRGYTITLRCVFLDCPAFTSAIAV
jgi:hypothetical protein